MQDGIYTPEKIAELLELKVTTVRRFIRDGKLKAHKIGRQWRILAQDLAAFLGGEIPGSTGRPVEQAAGNSRTAPAGSLRMQVSTVVDVRVRDQDDAARINNAIVAVLNQKDPEYGEVRYDHLFYPGEGKSRHLFWGDARFIGEMLCMLARISA